MHACYGVSNFETFIKGKYASIKQIYVDKDKAEHMLVKVNICY